MEHLDEIVESVLFLAGDPVSRADICDKLQIEKKDLNKALDRLKERFSGDSGIILKEFGDKLQFSTNKKYADAVSSVLNPIKERALSKAAMETLAIVAYKQPVTRIDIEDIRGVGSDYTINLLLENNLIEIVGRKEALGRPLLFGTTDEFLRRFELQSTADLPGYESLLDRLGKVSTGKEDDRLFNFENMPDEKSAEKSIALEQKEKKSKEEFEILDVDDNDEFL